MMLVIMIADSLDHTCTVLGSHPAGAVCTKLVLNTPLQHAGGAVMTDHAHADAVQTDQFSISQLF